MKILVVEDHVDLANSLKSGLESQSYAVDIENDGEHGFYKAKTTNYDLIILDNVLPGKEGRDICRDLREYKINVPILMLSAQDDVEKKVEALDYGADDYITKPFSFRELSARVTALLRRPIQMEESVLTVDDLILDRKAYTASRAGKFIDLTPKEFGILEYLMKNQGKVVSRTDILEHVWDDTVDQLSNNVDMHIANLRHKIHVPGKKILIRTVFGRGYKIENSSET